MYQVGRLPKYAKKNGKLISWKNLPSWELTYPTYEKGKSSGPVTFKGDMFVPCRVTWKQNSPDSPTKTSIQFSLLVANAL